MSRWSDPSWACTKPDEHCLYCGRLMVETRESGLFDPETGARETIRWHSCPKYFGSWRNLWGLFAGTHQSHDADNPMLAREWH
jgi:hypothetical protein